MKASIVAGLIGLSLLSSSALATNRCASALNDAGEQPPLTKILTDLGYDAEIAERVLRLGDATVLRFMQTPPWTDPVTKRTQAVKPHTFYRALRVDVSHYNPVYADSTGQVYFSTKLDFVMQKYAQTGGIVLRMQLPSWEDDLILAAQRSSDSYLARSGTVLAIPDDRIFLKDIGIVHDGGQIEWIAYHEAVTRGLIQDLP